MEKKFCALVFTFMFVVLSTAVHSSPSTLQRGPSVEPIVEVDIEETNTPSNSAGYDFSAVAPKSRVPANIVTKSDAVTPSSLIGPLIFLIALPIGLWMIVSKKIRKNEDEKAVDYYPKTHQFKPYKTDYQKSAEDDDDVDFPKAS